jgi:hypothetical protein
MDISQSVWNEADGSNSSAAPDGAPEGMFPSGVNDTIRADRGAIKRWYNQTIPLLTAGSSTAYTLAYGVAPTALADGMTHLVEFNATNGAAATLNVNALGAKPLYTYQAAGWAAAPAGVITPNMVSRVAYNAAAGAYRVLEVAAAGTWTPVDASGASLSFSNVVANYQVHGNMVHAYFYFYLSYPVNASGVAATIGGLPVTVPNVNYVNTAAFLDGNGVNLNASIIRPQKNATTFQIIGQSGLGAAANSNLSNVTISGCVMYPAS